MILSLETEATISISTMKGTFLLVLLLTCFHQSNSCDFVNSALICTTTIPSEFPPGASTLLIYVSDFGEMNSSVFHHESLASVSSVIIRGAGLTGIAEGAFRSFLNLRSLTLDQNELKEVQHKWLGRPGVLSELSLSENLISALSGEMLEGFTNLSKLDLRKNRISRVQPGSFSGLAALGLLDLSDNSLTRLNSQVFSPVHSINMSLQGNPWICSCEEDDFSQFMVDLKSRSLLLQAEDVACAGPPALKGRPVWDTSVCNTTLPTDLPTDPTPDTETPGPSQSTTIAALTTFHDLNVSRPIQDIKTTINQKTASIVTHQSPPYPAPNIVPMLIIIIVVLCIVLLLVIVLAVFYRRKRSRKTVAPKDQSQEAAVEQGRQKKDMRWDIETPCHMPFTGVRARSAHAILSTSPLGATGEHHKNLPPSKGEGGEEDVEDGVEDAGAIGAERASNHSFTSSAGSVQNATTPAECENVPYLSIGSCPNETSGDKNASVTVSGRGLCRISTWPPTAVQWKERCKRQREQEGEKGQPDGTQTEESKVPYDLDKADHLPDTSELNVRKAWENNAGIEWCFKGEETQQGKDLGEANMTDPAQSCSSVSNKEDLISSDSLVNLEEATGEDHDLRPKNASVQRGNVGMSSKQRGEGRRSASIAPSGGKNELVFRDLLQEVVQNRGRWTRDRWRQIHMSKEPPGQQEHSIGLRSELVDLSSTNEVQEDWKTG